jgi:hypothetical protein
VQRVRRRRVRPGMMRAIVAVDWFCCLF